MLVCRLQVTSKPAGRDFLGLDVTWMEGGCDMDVHIQKFLKIFEKFVVFPIGSMGRLYIYLHERPKFMVKVGEYTSPMDPMGYQKHLNQKADALKYSIMFFFVFHIFKFEIFRVDGLVIYVVDVFVNTPGSPNMNPKVP